MKKLFSCFFILTTLFSFATQRPVPANYPTIQSALNACSMGDTVVVQPGAYLENLTWPNTKNIKLFSAGDSSNTIIDANYVGRCITIINSIAGFIDTNTVISGFKLRNGFSNTPTLNGAAMYVSGSTPLFKNLAITNCNVHTAATSSVGTLSGGVISMTERGILKNCAIYSNAIYNSSGSINGGLVYMFGSGTNPGAAYGNIYNTKIYNNSVCINGNSINGGLINGAMDLNKLSVVNNIVLDTGNTASANMNGLIYVNGSNSLTQQITKSTLIANNTFLSNTLVNVSSMGIYYFHLSSTCFPTNYNIYNVTVADNKAITNGAVAGMACYIVKQGNCNFATLFGIPHLNITNSIFYNPFNASVNPVQQLGASVLSIQSTATLNPQFVSTTDHHLQVTSPAINAGIFAGLLDDRDFTPVTSPSGTFPDIGCYEMNQPTGTLVATANISNATVCAGMPVTFTNTTLNTKNCYWTTTPTGSSSYSNTFTISTPTVGTYTVNLMVADSSNAIGSSVFVITALPVPSISATASSASVCLGQSVTLFVASSNTVSSYTWYNAATSTSIVVTPTNSGYYSVTAQNSYSCSTTTSIYVAVAVVSVIQSSNYVCPGVNVTLTAVPISTASTYLWFNGATTQSIVVTPTVPASSASYSVIVQDACSAIGNGFINVYPSAPPIPTISASTYTACSGQSFTLFTTYSLVDAFYHWSNGVTSQVPQITITPAASGAYSLSVANSNGCAAPSNTIFVNVFSIPNPTVTASSNSICIGQNASLTANSTNAVSSYLWFNGSGSQSVVITPTVSNSYSVILQNGVCSAVDSIYVNVYSYPSTPTIIALSNSVCVGHSITLSAVTNSPVNSYLWSNGATTQNINVTPTVTTIYSLLAQNSINCTAPSNTVVVNVFPTPNPTITTSSYSICASENFTFNVIATNTISSYLWYNGATTQSIIASPTISGTYTVMVQNTYGCSSQASVYAVVYACTNLKSNSLNENVSIYPNPNNGVFIIENNTANAFKYDVLDLLGQLLCNGEIDKAKKEIQIKNSPKGVYFLRLTDANAGITTKRIIIQ